MQDFSFRLGGDQIALWGLNVLMLVTWVVVLAMSATYFLQRDSAARHWLLCAALLLVLLSPAVALWQQQSGRTALKLAVAPAAISRESAGDRSEVIDLSGADAIGFSSDARARQPLARPRHSAAIPPMDDVSEILAQRELIEDPFVRTGGGAPGSGMESRSMKRPLAVVPNHPGATGQEAPEHSITSGAALLLKRCVPPLLLIWLVGAAILLVKFARGCYRLSGILRSARSGCDVATERALARAGRALRLTVPPKLLLSDQISGPISAGVFRPCIILPERIVPQITPQQLYEVLLHETAHVVRRDHLIVVLQNLAGILFWVHPLVKALNRRLAQAREELCDNYVLAATDAPSYSRTLLKLAMLAQSNQLLPGTVGLFNARWKLEWRVAGLLDERRGLGTRLTWRTCVILSSLTALVGILAAFGTVSLAKESDAPQTHRDVVSSALPVRQAASPARVPESVVALAQKPGNEDRWPDRPDDGLLTLNLTIRMPDGSPAAEASVTSLTQWRGQVQTARTDAAGRVTIRAIFGQGIRIHARSADESFQATLNSMALEARELLAKPLELTLAPAIDHRVKVTAEERPVANAQVVAESNHFRVLGVTGADGVAQLKLPADDRLNAVSAWHPELGIAGVWDLRKEPSEAETALSLLPPAPLTIRVVDTQDKAVRDLKICVSSAYMGMGKRGGDQRNFVLTENLPASERETDERGEIKIPWLPRDGLVHVNVELVGMSWKIDDIERPTPSRRVVTLHVCRRVPVTGRLIMPDGASAEGLLITGFGFGPKNHGDVPQVRARRDGTFVINAPSDYGYVLGLFDRQWACELWTGRILKTDDAEPATLDLVVRRAVPVSVRVTRGPNREPVAGASIDFDRQKQFQWVNASGQKKNAGGSVGGWIKTGTNGIAYGGTGRGTLKVRLAAGDWEEDKTLEVTDDNPLAVEFHREWMGNRQLIARMFREGTVYQPSKNLTLLSWTDKRPQVGPFHEPVLREDRTIEVKFDEKNLSLLVIDGDRQTTGYVDVGPDKDTAELEMRPNATYGGKIVNENGEPFAKQMVELLTENSFQNVSEPLRTDAAGAFRFTGVAVGVPLRLSIRNEEDEPKYFLFEQVQFEPGEVREGVKVQAHRQGARPKNAAPRPLEERLKSASKNVRVAGMRTVVILQGDDSENVVRLTQRLLGEEEAGDEDEPQESDDDDLPIYNYLPITVAAEQVKSEAEFLKQRNWTVPRQNELTLIALDAEQKTLASVTINVRDGEPAQREAEEFLTRHKPHFEDAREKLAKERERAQRDGRRVWVIIGGPRCGPCFSLARWIDTQRDLLEKDYVIVKLMGGLQPHADEISNEIGGESQGIPWFVITEPDGKILVTSAGPLGNMGMPSTPEDFRHLRKMLTETSRRLSSNDIDKLIESLSPDHE